VAAAHEEERAALELALDAAEERLREAELRSMEAADGGREREEALELEARGAREARDDAAVAAMAAMEAARAAAGERERLRGELAAARAALARAQQAKAEAEAAAAEALLAARAEAEAEISQQLLRRPPTPATPPTQMKQLQLHPSFADADANADGNGAAGVVADALEAAHEALYSTRATHGSPSILRSLPWTSPAGASASPMPVAPSPSDLAEAVRASQALRCASESNGGLRAGLRAAHAELVAAAEAAATNAARSGRAACPLPAASSGAPQALQFYGAQRVYVVQEQQLQQAPPVAPPAPAAAAAPVAPRHRGQRRSSSTTASLARELVRGRAPPPSPTDAPSPGAILSSLSRLPSQQQREQQKENANPAARFEGVSKRLSETIRRVEEQKLRVRESLASSSAPLSLPAPPPASVAAAPDAAPASLAAPAALPPPLSVVAGSSRSALHSSSRGGPSRFAPSRQNGGLRLAASRGGGVSPSPSAAAASAAAFAAGDDAFFAPPPVAWGAARRTPSPLRRGGGASDGSSEAERREFRRRAAALGLQLPM
jgi:hypothetical protein